MAAATNIPRIAVRLSVEWLGPHWRCSVAPLFIPTCPVICFVGIAPPRSGHYTQDGCQTSQFENHVRAVMGWPLGDTSLTVGCSIMLNLLGEVEGEEGVRRGGCF